MWVRSAARIARLANRARPTAGRVPAAVNVARIVSAGVAPAAQAKRFFSASSVARSGEMFCFQCEQTNEGKGCTTLGVCGKTPEVASLQDLTVHALKGICAYAYPAAQAGKRDPALERFLLDAMFATLTNVNFDASRFVEYLREAQAWEAKAKAMAPAGTNKHTGLNWNFSDDAEALSEEGKKFSVLSRKDTYGEDLNGVMEMIVYGLKGMSAYADHAAQVGYTDPAVCEHLIKALYELGKPEQTLDANLGLALETGKANLTTLALLDRAHTESFGHPSPAKARISEVEGKCILISGHDLKDLEALLQQTEGKGINVWTHGEMLPAHGYPNLRKYKHLIGNYGGPWQLQKLDFSMFPGPVVMTTNCLVEPQKGYKNRIWTLNSVGWQDVPHIENRDFAPVIEVALKEKGMKKTQPEKFVDVGFGHHTVLSLADTVVDLVKKGEIKHFFFIGGCDGAEAERTYFRDLAQATPKDTVILTAGCGKYRFNKLDLGTIANTGLPRVLDCGQCNDSYGAAVIALKLAEAFGTDINGLPLSFAVSWFEQKAVAVLLTLLHMGVKNIRLGPNLPAFITPAVLNVLVENWNIKPIGRVDEDLKNMLANA